MASVDLDIHDDDELAVQLFREVGRDHPGASRSLRHAVTGAALRLLRDQDVLVRVRIVGGHPYSALPGHHSRWQPRGVAGRFHRTDALPPAPFIDDTMAEHLIAWEHAHDDEFGRSAA